MPSHRPRRQSPSRSDHVETRKVLPARTSRGSRIHKLIDEEMEADASFWGQSAWQEDGEDEDYSTEAEEEDVVDSDFDHDEAPDDDVHDAAADDEPMKRKRATASLGRYKEPVGSRPAKRKAAVATTGTDVPVIAATPHSVTPVYRYVAPTVRSSTARKSSMSSEMRRRASTEAAKWAAKHKKPIVHKTGNRLTQAQLLAEAVRTEVENTQSLQRLEQLEEEKKTESVAPKVPFTGRMVRYYSKLDAPKTITFLNTLEFPPLFNQPKPKKRVSSQQQMIDRMRLEAEAEEEEEEAQDNGSAQGDKMEEKDRQQHGLVRNGTSTATEAAA